MNAITRTVFGGPEVLALGEVKRPQPAEDEVLVRVRAASVNPFDWHMLTGLPYLARIEAGFRRPKSELLGVDFAGTVESIGAKVSSFQPGDEVFGGRSGAFAEYLRVREAGAIAPKPEGVSFEHAAAVGIAGVTALQGLRNKGRLQAGQRVLVNGASGGVGTFAVQIAKALGAEVTGVCSTRNVEQAGALGAGRVIDYTQEDFTRKPDRYDLILDIAGNRSWPEYRGVLEPEGRLVIVGGPKGNRWLGGLGNPLLVRLRAVRDSQTVVAPFLASLDAADLRKLGELLQRGEVTPAIERTYSLAEVPEALRYVGQGHARGKVVIAVAD